jgi:hypothetical protein
MEHKYEYRFCIDDYCQFKMSSVICVMITSQVHDMFGGQQDIFQ